MTRGMYAGCATAILVLGSLVACSKGRIAPGCEDGIVEAHDCFESGKATSYSLVRYSLARIESLDERGPKLRAVLDIEPNALSIADKKDAERKRSRAVGLLHGIPIVVKDNIDTAGMSTTAGSLALLASKPTRDAFIVRRLKSQGAIILGKTNLSEWAYWRSSRASSGWSARGGQTKNPYALDRSPCGSSSGSAVAVAAGLAVAAIGTETDGSIACPSAFNGIVGLKPTVGLVSRAGIIPISTSQDTAGPMTRSVADAAILLRALAGYDPDDPATAVLKDREVPDYTRALDKAGLKGARIGVARNLTRFHEAVDEVFEQALTALRAAGAELVDPANLETAATLRDDEYVVLLYEFREEINRYLATRASGPRSLAQLIAFNNREAAREMPYFGQEIFEQAETTPPTREAYLGARERARKAAGPDGIDALLKKYQLDAIVAPTVGLPWTIDLINGDRLSRVVAPPMAAFSTPDIAGYPHITIPAGFAHGLPVGISFIGTAWSEETLLKLAYAFEQATRARRPPDFRASAH